MSKQGPVVYEKIYMSAEEKALDTNTLDSINDHYLKTGNLDFLGNGEVNVELGLQQSDDTVYVADDELLKHLNNCKSMYPELPLLHAIKAMPYEEVTSKTR